ncbi:MAG: PQQ-binding-like beta-propeller repeat protein [Vicinamibacterales bacterium]
MTLAAVLLGALTVLASWPQWGGPNRNFVTEATLAPSWPSGGPAQLWRRPLGDGFSAIVTDGTTLYTTYRSGGDDVVAALDAGSGKTRWETKYAAPFNETCSEQLGPAPRSAPLITGKRLITISAGALMHSFDLATGEKQWSAALVPSSSDAAKPCGYSTSPIAFGNTIITTAGGKGRGVVAIDAQTGREVWAVQDFLNGYSSPVLIDLDGRPELIVFTAGEVSGLDPKTGALEWSRPHPADFGVNVAMPIWGDDHLLFVSSAYNGGSRVLKLARQGETVKVDELWANKKVRIHFGNAVRLGTRIYASNGDFGSAPFAAVDIATGEMLWRDRSVARATLIGAGGRLLILDEDGNLTLASPGAEGLAVNGRVQVFTGRSWTVPTLSGSRLFLRDRKEIVALDLR